MSPYSLQQITQVGYVGVLFNGVGTLTSSTQHVLHLQCTSTMQYQCKMSWSNNPLPWTNWMHICTWCTVHDHTYPQSALPHELTDKLCVAVWGESKSTTPTTSTRAKTMNLNKKTKTKTKNNYLIQPWICMDLNYILRYSWYTSCDSKGF